MLSKIHHSLLSATMPFSTWIQHVSAHENGRKSSQLGQNLLAQTCYHCGGQYSLLLCIPVWFAGAGVFSHLEVPNPHEMLVAPVVQELRGRGAVPSFPGTPLLPCCTKIGLGLRVCVLWCLGHTWHDVKLRSGGFCSAWGERCTKFSASTKI